MRRKVEPFELALASALHIDVDHASNIEELLRILLEMEKERRGFEKDDLVFVAMANVADYWWCAFRSVLQSKEEELGFFDSYLSDRVNYWYELRGLTPSIDSLPRSPEELTGNRQRHIL